MKNIITFFVSFFLIVSCSKDKSITPIEPPLPDSIESSQLAPVIEFSSADSVYYVPFGPGCPVAAPVNSQAHRELDFNGDSVNSFSIKMEHWYEFLSASNPCVNYNYRIYAIGLEQNETAGIIDKGGVINSNLNWSSSSVIMRKGGRAHLLGFQIFPIHLMWQSELKMEWDIITVGFYLLNQIMLFQFTRLL